jgi:hypothetical protein
MMSDMPEAAQNPAPTPACENPAKAGQDRPFRLKLRGSVLMLVRLPNRREIRGKLHQLSTTGGLMNLEKALDEKLVVELIFHLGEATIREKAQMMFPMWATQGWLQPFRFIDLPEATRTELEKTLLQFKQAQQGTVS